MIFSFKELKRVANLSNKITIDEIVNAINSIGFEVEEVRDFAKISGVKFGKVLNVYKNPNGDNLYVCEIQFEDKIRIIQTTASNVKSNTIVVAFIPGSKFKDIVFETKKIKGIISEGMLTNPSEFDINEEWLRTETKNEIYAYKNVVIADDVIEKLGLDDKLIYVNILSNRSDAASYYVMAKEIAAFFGVTYKDLSIKKGSLKSTKKVISNKAHHIAFIEAKNDFHISIKEEILLAKHNIKSINNAVDLSNLALIYSGLPVHIYDATKIGNSLSVDYSSQEVIMLGNKKVKLNNNLVIKDENKEISLASVIGFENSKSESTSAILLIEIGIFPPNEIRKSLKQIKLNTMASMQGMKKISYGTLNNAISYLTNKLSNFSNIINEKQFKNEIVTFNEKEFVKVIGKEIKNDVHYQKAQSALYNLGFVFQNNQVTIPLYRHDIKIQEDINEEILRFYGYKNLNSKPLSMVPMNIKENRINKAFFIANGYSEVKTYSLISQAKNIINPFMFKNEIKLKIVVSKEREVIRNAQVVSLLEIANFNVKRNMKNINIFSFGMINNGIKTFALLSNTKNFNKMKNDIINIIPNLKFKRFTAKGLHPNISTQIIFNQKIIGYIAKVHPNITNEDYIIAEILDDNYKLNVNYKMYDLKPLKYNDVNIILKPKEDIAPYIEKYQNKYVVQIIDRYKVGFNTKITIRIYE